MFRIRVKRCSTSISAIRPATTTAAAGLLMLLVVVLVLMLVVLLVLMLMLMLGSIQSACCGSRRWARAWNGAKLDLVHS